MKTPLMVLTIIIATTFSLHSSAAPSFKEKVLVIDQIYVPSGLTSANEAYVGVGGIFPNGCYHWARADVYNAESNLHEIRAVAFVVQTNCPMVTSPFQQKVILGRLQTGQHLLRFINGNGTSFERILQITD